MEVRSQIFQDEVKGGSTESGGGELRIRGVLMRSVAAATSASGSPSNDKISLESESSGVETPGKRLRAGKETFPPPVTPPDSGKGVDDPFTPAPNKEAAVVDPVYGTLSVLGRSREMEDTIAAVTRLCVPEINWRLPVHFFGVYDGHGGSHVSTMCKDRLHVLIKEELMSMEQSMTTEYGGGGSSSSSSIRLEELEEMWTKVLKRSFARMDEVALRTCSCGRLASQCDCHSPDVELCGSAVVVVLLTQEHIVIANCGDSRAVLYRDGRAIPLSSDHKPDRPDELARIEASGGYVFTLDGPRVEGVLAMSRAIGDESLKPAVTSEPDVTFRKREAEDDFLILASDGIWDVMPNELACEVAYECLRGEGYRLQTGGTRTRPLRTSRTVQAATVLTRLALGRKSMDNISVIVVDLKRS